MGADAPNANFEQIHCGEDRADEILAYHHDGIILKAMLLRLVAVQHWRILLTLAHHNGATAAEIIARWALQPMSVSRAIRELDAVRSSGASDQMIVAAKISF